MTPSYTRMAALCAVAGSILLNTTPARAVTWDGPVGGAFDDALNWSDDTLPSSTSVADLGAGTAIYSGTTVNPMTVQGLRGSSGSFTMTAGTLDIASASYADNFGTSGTASFSMTGGTINLSGNILRVGSDGGSTTFSMSNDAVLNVTAAYLVFGNSAAVTGTMSDTSKITSSNRLYIGDSNSSGNASLTLSGSSSIQSTGGEFVIGRGDSTGSLTLNEYAYATQGSGGLTLSNSTGTASLTLNGNSAFTVEGGGLTLSYDSGTSSVELNDESAFTLSAGDISMSRQTGNSSITLNGNSSFTAASSKIKMGDNNTTSTIQSSITLNDASSMTVNQITVGHIGGDGATASVNINDNATLTVADHITLGRDDGVGFGVDSILNVNGGTLATKYIENGGSGGTGEHTVNIDGGALKALQDTTDFFPTGSNNTVSATVNIESGGLTFDTNGYVVGIGADMGGAGGLTVTGGGTLTLNVASSYLGDTVVADASTLSFSSIYLSDTANVSLETGSTLELAFTGTDTIGAFYIDGIAQLTGTWGAIGSGADYESSLIGGDGLLLVTAVPEPTTVSMGIVGMLGLAVLVRRSRRKA